MQRSCSLDQECQQPHVVELLHLQRRCKGTQAYRNSSALSDFFLCYYIHPMLCAGQMPIKLLVFNTEDNCIVLQMVKSVPLLLCCQELLRRWMSLQHHITGVHRWEENGTEYRCFHKDLSAEEQRTKRWLKVNSPAFKALQAMIMDTRLLKDLQQMTLFKHTGMCFK